MLCVDESVIPFVERLSFRQYLKINAIDMMFKYSNCVYIMDLQLIFEYASREAVSGLEVSTKIVIEMTHEYLNFGRNIL